LIELFKIKLFRLKSKNESQRGGLGRASKQKTYRHKG